MTDPFFVADLEVSGFRAYLNPHRFDLSKKDCLAVFGQNASGKSSLVDAIEFHLSETGTLERLGGRAINNYAGPIALKHNLADEKGISSQVSMTFRAGAASISGVRSARGKRAITAAARKVRGTFAVDPIIRGYSLRSFVELQPAEARYTSVANWLNLGPLVEVQKNVRALRQQLKSAAESQTHFQQIDQALGRLTGTTLRSWVETAVLAHANAAIANIDKSLSIAQLAETDPTCAILKMRADEEANRLGLTALKHRLGLAEALHRLSPPAADGEAKANPSLMDAFETALQARADATQDEANERTKAEKSVFSAVWEAARPLFADDAATPGACPVCDTPLAETKAGSAAGVAKHLAKHLGDLTIYKAAQDKLAAAQSAAKEAYQNLVIGVQALIAQDLTPPIGDLLTAYLHQLKNGPRPTVENVAILRAAISTLAGQLSTEIATIEARQGDATYRKTWQLVSDLLDLKRERDLAERVRRELAALSNELNRQATTVTAEIRNAVQGLLDVLNRPMNEIYKAIQGPKARPVRLELPPEEDANQQRLHLLIDFARNREGVQPAGYLSDSQIHSLALAFRLSAILEFNTDARFVVLDDIVTSYDAEHRRTLAGLIADQLSALQVVLVTHDERFFHYLRDQLAPARWRFSRIVRLDPDFGPRFSDVQMGDDAIQARWDAGQSAANEMRQAEEEWLLSVCRDFGVSIQIRPLERPYSYERGELATSLAAFLKDRKLLPPLVPGVKNPFLQSLVNGTVENFGSHFQDNPNAISSLGDEQARWNEFTQFRDLFCCPSCDRRKFKRFNLQKPICAHEKCEVQFVFKTFPPSLTPTLTPIPASKPAPV